MSALRRLVRAAVFACWLPRIGWALLVGPAGTAERLLRDYWRRP